MIDPATTVGPVHLIVSDVKRLSEFYVRSLGMRMLDGGTGTATLGAGHRPLLSLSEHAGAARAAGTTGLYHFAVLVPSRFDLARSLRLLAETDTPLQGASDHGVSEALYLADPDGNGIEIYRDRPREQWPQANGLLNMTVDPLDRDDVLGELGAGPADRALDPRTVVGHVHLHVSRLPEAEAFYCGALGFDVTQRYGRSALFVSAGKYHHHIGLNTWAGVGLPPAPAGSLGLKHFVVNIPGEGERDRVLARLAAAGIAAGADDNGILVRDPSGNAMLLTA